MFQTGLEWALYADWRINHHLLCKNITFLERALNFKLFFKGVRMIYCLSESAKKAGKAASTLHNQRASVKHLE